MMAHFVTSAYAGDWEYITSKSSDLRRVQIFEIDMIYLIYVTTVIKIET